MIEAPPAAEAVLSEPIFAVHSEPPLFREERIPHLGHLGLLALLVLFGLIGTMMLVPLALHFHLFGVTSIAQASTDYRYALGSQAAQYFITFGGCLMVFPIIWRKPFFDGIHWHGATALHRTARLISAAVLCFFVAMINGVLMPGPTNAPIDQLFKAPGAAWVLFAFGVTLAPFFEEMAFRGFVLPSLCTAYDWCLEHFTGAPRRPLDEYDNPQWSLPAMIVGSLLTSVPFAVMHGAQTSWSLGPFLLLIFVSLVLCSVRLHTRSLAASTLVHAFYNFMLFSFMLLGTGGFKHLDKM
jgi:membrane protease YdiL (CAAX protease family)